METVDKGILVTPDNGDQKIMQHPADALSHLE